MTLDSQAGQFDHGICSAYSLITFKNCLWASHSFTKKSKQTQNAFIQNGGITKESCNPELVITHSY